MQQNEKKKDASALTDFYTRKFAFTGIKSKRRLDTFR